MYTFTESFLNLENQMMAEFSDWIVGKGTMRKIISAYATMTEAGFDCNIVNVGMDDCTGEDTIDIKVKLNSTNSNQDDHDKYEWSLLVTTNPGHYNNEDDRGDDDMLVVFYRTSGEIKDCFYFVTNSIWDDCKTVLHKLIHDIQWNSGNEFLETAKLYGVTFSMDPRTIDTPETTR